MADLVADLMARVQSQLGSDARVRLTEIEQQVRREWGGRWVYVPQRTDCGSRDALIRDALKQGARPAHVAVSFGLSVRQVFRIAQREDGGHS